MGGAFDAFYKYQRSNRDRKHYNHYPTNYTKVPDVNSLSANTTDGKGTKDNKNKAINTRAKLLPKLFILTLGSDFHLKVFSKNFLTKPFQLQSKTDFDCVI